MTLLGDLCDPIWVVLRARETVVLLALGCGCAAPRAVGQAPATERPPIAVAVIGFGGSDASASPAEDGCVMAVLEAGYRVVGRQQVVAALPNENDVDFSTVGRALGADVIIDGGVARGSGADSVPLEPRLISSHSANLLGVASSHGRVKLSRVVGQKLCTKLLGQLP